MTKLQKIEDHVTIGVFIGTQILLYQAPRVITLQVKKILRQFEVVAKALKLPQHISQAFEVST